jgi:hypothetical protein
LVQPVQVGVGGQLGVEHQLNGKGARLLVPEIDEAEDFVCLLGLGDASVGIAENALGGITGQEGQNAFLAAAAPRDMVFLQRFLLGIEIEVERGPPWQARLMDIRQPGVQQAQADTMVDAGAIGGPIGTLGDDIEAGGKERKSHVMDLVCDEGLALFEQLEGQQAAHRLGGRNHDGAGQSGLLNPLIQMEVPHQGHEQEKTAQPGTEGTWAQAQEANVGRDGWFGMNGGWAFLIAAAWQERKAFLTEQQGPRGDADGVPGLS